MSDWSPQAEAHFDAGCAHNDATGHVVSGMEGTYFLCNECDWASSHDVKVPPS